MSNPSLGMADHGVVEVRFDGPISISNPLADLANLTAGATVGHGHPGEPELPWINVVIPHVDGSGTANWELSIIGADTLALRECIPPIQPDIVSSDTSQPVAATPSDTGVYNTDAWYPATGVIEVQRGSIVGTSASSLVWCPFRYNPVRQELIVIRRAAIARSHGGQMSPSPVATDTVPALDDIKPLVLSAFQRPGPDEGLRSPAFSGAPSWTLSPALPLGISYVVITNRRLAETMQSLVLWKARRGIAAGLATVEDIVARYSAVDTAASIREYLKDAYTSGLKWVVLAGDQSVVPIRYAFAGYQPAPADLHQFQICDLYYADLDGDWDANGNGVWGEYFGDEPDMYAELFVGRLPFSQTSEAETIVGKIIAYEGGPADPLYLTRALSLCADQMRDFSAGTGQQNLVAEVMPEEWTHDESSMLEQPSGIDPSPLTPDAPNLAGLLAGGFGWVNYYVHGRADGFVVRSPGYLNSPRAYVYTFGSSGDGNGHLNELPTTGFAGIHISSACDQGAFDMDSPPFNPPMQSCVAEKLLFMPQAGAVAFIGQSRWGWVSSSYKLISKFYQYIVDTSVPNHIGIYQEMAKIAYPGYRDLNYGNNLYGDPEMPVWKDVPKELSVTAPETHEQGNFNWELRVSDENGPVSGALATVASGNSVWSIGETDGDGEVEAEFSLPSQAEAILTISKPGYRIIVDTIPSGIIADVGDDGSATPKRFTFLTNVPNPFNPSTSVEFGIAKPSHVRITVFDILGRPVATLLDKDLDAGPHRIEFAGTDRSGDELSSGVYFARLVTGGRSVVRKMVLLR
ncbi:MAG: T9SS type A sorting domain-containing protein [candidate division Zixibacteria bacterium]|nr:T9SS type A sorting domain-containing protein [candidate division Zixibacteria bacterium]